MPNDQGSKPKTYDLETRTFEFAQRAVRFCRELPKTLVTVEITRQLVRSATSVGANYIEANEALSKKDFVMRVKICRKEAKESAYWLKLIDTGEAEVTSAGELAQRIYGVDQDFLGHSSEKPVTVIWAFVL